jgi:NAD(P)-dependent dehydrogenase (short-subunit alcohol dehydrogenase family)
MGDGESQAGPDASEDVTPYLAGSAIVVTGAGRGIGAAAARHIGRLGASVTVNDRDPDVAEAVAESIVAGGGTAHPFVADVSRWDEAEALIASCVQTYGHIDGLLNNAAIVRLARPDELDEATLRTVIETNLLGSSFCGVHAIRQMLSHGGGTILNVTSGSQAGWRFMSAYGASKGGIASMTYCWALDLAGTGIRVNAVSPVAATRLREHFAEYLGDSYRPKPGPTPDDNAPVIAYLLSPQSAPLTGQVVRIDGTRLCLMAHPDVLEPVQVSERWTFAGVAAAFNEVLNERAVPVGTLDNTKSQTVPRVQER